MMLFELTLLLLCYTHRAFAKCYDPSPAFPKPKWDTQAQDELRRAFGDIESQLDRFSSQGKYHGSSFSLSVTSSADTILESFHAAKSRNSSRPGTEKIDGHSVYRIASISKVFTTLALLQLHDAGSISLDDAITDYLPELLNADESTVRWKRITIRSLASQLSGIPRELEFGDLANDPSKAPRFGLPPNVSNLRPSCGSINHGAPCKRSELLDYLKDAQPLFAPNQKSTYSNLNFDILGLVIANVSKTTYEDYVIQKIFRPIDMISTSFDAPTDEHAVLPIGFNFWDINLGIENPTGGIYSSSDDLSKFARFILTRYNDLAEDVNWLFPASWATGVNTFYGMPFETFRTDIILDHSRRPVTFVTKAGALPGYFSVLIILEEYDLAIVILVGGQSSLLDEVREVVTAGLVRAAERIVWRRLNKSHAGQYFAEDTKQNSSVVLSTSASKGLFFEKFVMNGKDILTSSLPLESSPDLQMGHIQWHLQLVPTLLFKNESTKEGEIFRALVVSERYEGEEDLVWNDFCMTDVQTGSYNGRPLNEVVFWHAERMLEVTAWRVKLHAVAQTAGERVLVVQDSTA